MEAGDAQVLPAVDSSQSARAAAMLEEAYIRAPAWDPLLRAAVCCNLAVSLAEDSGDGDKCRHRQGVTRAVTLLTEALRVCPSHVPSLASLARIYAAKGEHAKAQQTLYKAHLLSPEAVRIGQDVTEDGKLAARSSRSSSTSSHASYSAYTSSDDQGDEHLYDLKAQEESRGNLARKRPRVVEAAA